MQLKTAPPAWLLRGFFVGGSWELVDSFAAKVLSSTTSRAHDVIRLPLGALAYALVG